MAAKYYSTFHEMTPQTPSSMATVVYIEFENGLRFD